jgi:TonB-linked SusC/RagA family outer membrane protein
VTSVDDGQPLPYVNVSVKGTTVGTITDFDGNYTLKANDSDVLVFSFIDFKTQEVNIDTQTTINVALESDNLMLNEVVAIGYGTMKKSDLTGAVTSIKADALKKTPASGLDQALQGRAAGVTVNANSGQPGQAAEVRIRGIGSVVGDCAPIYVVDGVITDNISFLSPSDITSTEILKDASATAIYGSRGANGVILVTTKNGTKGEGNISVDAYWGIQNRWNKLELMSSKELAMTKLRIDAMKNGASQLSDYINDGFNEWMQAYNIGKSKYAPAALTTRNPQGFDYNAVETDWQDEVFQKNAKIQSYSISMDGGNDKGHYAFTANYFQQEGTIIGSDYERFTLRVNADYQIKEWLKIGEHISFATSTGRNAMNNNASPGASIISAALAMAPWDPTHYPAGTISADKSRELNNQIAASTNFKNVTNPFSMVEHSNPENKLERLIGDIYMEITPIKGLIWRTAANLDFNLKRDKLFKDKYLHSDYDKAEKNYISSSMQRYSTFAEETTLTYNNDFGAHSLSVMLGQTLEEFKSYNIGGAGASILNADDENNWYLSHATEDRTDASDGVSRSRRLSFLGRLHYTLSDKYMLTFNFRADGSSKFPQNTWGYFPSMALAWRISEETFLSDVTWLNYAKVRFGWGRVGNDKVGDDSFTQTMFTTGPTFVGYPFGTSQEVANGSTVLVQVNQNGKWENNEQWNAGVDFSLYDGAINGNVDCFLRNTKDALLYVNAPAHVGNRHQPLANVGVLSNHGVEIALEYNNTVGELQYSLGGNISFIKNELKELNGGQPLWGDRTVCNEGLAMRTFWGYEFESVYQSNAEALKHQWTYTNPNEISVHAGDARYKDRDNNGIIDGNDRTDLGNPFPWLTYGFNISASYKGFDLQAFFQGVYGNKIYNALRERTEGAGDVCTLAKTAENVWIGYSDEVRAAMARRGLDYNIYENRNGTIPNPLGAASNAENNNRLVEDGSYLRLKNVQLGYTLPTALVRKAKIEKIRIYISATNLWTLTDYSGFDPEVGGGVDYGNYPQSRTVTFGLNLNL